VVIRWIISSRAASARSLPPLIIPMSPNGAPDRIDMALLRKPKPTPPAPARAQPPRPAPAVVSAQAAPAPQTAPVAAAAPAVDTNGHPPGGETVRFFRPTDEPVQLLPGRLEVLAGTTRHREIRFVRIPGEPLQLFVGRDAGPSPQYIGLGAATVSRRHARFAYADGQWLIKNLSQTNPVVVNDDELSNTDGERALVDGDRVELGEVILVYHAQ